MVGHRNGIMLNNDAKNQKQIHPKSIASRLSMNIIAAWGN
jgi:hypothetical protein